jgi:hypothetical protein
MTDWAVATERLRAIFVDKARRMRLDIPADEIAEEAGKAFLARTPVDDGSWLMEGSGLEALIRRINSGHKDGIVRIANEIGAVVEEERGEGDFVEDEENIFVRANGLLIKIHKETALKILMLGEIP